MEAPAQIMKGMEATKYYAMLDCWQAFHSIELNDRDREFTRLTMQWGYYRYKRAPQGFLSSTDAYNLRLNEILKDYTGFQRRCIDDIVIFGNTK